jgi:hypothetical protein
MAVAIAMVRAGWSEADFIRELSEPTNLLSSHYRFKDPECGRRIRRGRGIAAAAKKMRYDWRKAVARAAESPQVRGTAEARQQLGVFQMAVYAATWLGARRFVLQRLLIELIVIGMEQGSMSPTMGVRGLSKRLRCNEATVSRRLHRLQLESWLVIIRSSDPAMPNSYRLTVPPEALSSVPVGTVRNCNSSLPLTRGVRAVAVSDTTVEGPLDVDGDVEETCGTGAAMVEASLREGARNVAAIRARTGLARETIHLQLRRLRAMALVVKDAAGRWMRTARAAAAAVGVEAHAKRVARATRHALQRAAWHYRLSHLPWTVRRSDGRPGDRRVKGVSRSWASAANAGRC